MDSFKPPAPLNLNEDTSENWKFFKQKFEIFIKATQYDEKPEEVKVAMFLNCIGDEALQVFNTFKLTDAEKKKLNSVIKSFEEYCNPRKNVVFKRFQFFNRSQVEGETFDQFHTDLKRLAKNCDFGDQESSLIRDKIIIGIKDRGIQEKLLRETDVTLERTITFCRAAEISKEQVKALQDHTSVVVDTVYNRSNNNTNVKHKQASHNSNSAGEPYNWALML